MSNSKWHLTVKFIVQYVAGLLVWLMVVLIAGLVGWYMVRKSRIWYVTDPFFPFLHWAKDNPSALFLLAFGFGGLLWTLVFALRAFRYFRLMVRAAQELAWGEEGAIRLPAFLKEIQDEMNRLKEEERRNRAIAKEAEQRKNDLIVYLAHDLKTPLTSVIGYLSLLDEQPDLDEEKRRSFTGIALKKAMRLEELINEFFEITRYNLSSITLDLETINLTRMAEQTANEFLPVLREKGLVWEMSFARDVKFLCDADKLARVFDNLARNAVQYSYPETAICFLLEEHPDFIRIVMKNHGRTIAPDKLGRLFEQFFRADRARGTQEGGSGLGLAIAKEIVELHGGSITAESADETVTFTVVLPKRGGTRPSTTIL